MISLIFLILRGQKYKRQLSDNSIIFQNFLNTGFPVFLSHNLENQHFCLYLVLPTKNSLNMTFKSILILCCCFYFIQIQAQTHPKDKVEDSLRKELVLLSTKPRTAEQDSLVIKTLAKLFMSLPSKEIKGREFLNDSLKRFASKSSWEKAFAYRMYISAFMHTFRGENTLAFNDIEKALIAFKELKDEENYENSVERLGILMARNMMVQPIKDSLLAKKYLKYISARLEEVKTKFGGIKLAGANSSMGHYYFMKKEYAKSAKFYEAEMKYASLNTNKNLEFYEYNTGLFFAKGLCLLYKNADNQEAKKVVENIIEKCKIEKYNNYEKYLLLVIVHYMGNYYAEKNDFQNALKIGLIGQNIEDFPQMPFYEYLVNNVLAKAYKGLNQPDKAFPYLEKVLAYQEKSGVQELSGNLAEWQLKYEDEKQKTLIKTLENEKLQTEANRQKWLSYFLIFSLLGGIGFIIYVSKNNQKLKIKNQEIEEALIKGQTLERKRVALELHDNLSAKISGIRWRLEAVSPNFTTKKEQEVYEKSILTLAEVYTDVRLIAHNLLPDELETKGLQVALKKLVDELNSLGKTQFILEVSSEVERYSKKIEYEVYSLILELSSNVLKHSKASNALIKLNRVASFFLLQVEDNGIGLVENNDSKGMGIDNLKSRVETLKGKIQFESNQGLSVNISIPV
jgi:signal transduction histidine kinase